MSSRSRMRPGHIVSMWTLIFGHFYIGCLGASSDMPEILKVSAVTGSKAALPCTPIKPDDVQLVVLYKDDKPVYSYDGRISGPTSHWADDTLTGRAYWQNGEPSTLQIRDVVATDRALYRCRVDFRISPTLNQKILLDVIELPNKPSIFNENNKEVIEFAGPYIEGDTMKLTCVVSGGNPMPRLLWWRNDNIISTLPPTNDGSSLSVLELRILKLTREYFEAVYYCTADNTALVQPSIVQVQIQLYLRPLIVEILAREQPLSVQHEANIACRTVGARPPAEISWWLDNVRLTSAEQKSSDNQNETLSVLRWTPQMENNEQVLVCRATHSVLKNWTLQTNFTLDLHYVPIVVLQLGSNLNPDDVKEGDAVYFECAVRANPPPYKINWKHDGMPIKHNQRAGIIVASANLAIQRVSKEHAGTYSCTASNVEGDTSSTPVTLHVIFKPVCKMTSMALVGANIDEKVDLSCDVDAYPRPVSYQWVLNNSLESVKMDSCTISKGSHITFTLKSKADYGTVSCKASNTGGQQETPCLYMLIPAVRPDRPRHCSASNITDHSVELRCIAGYDGGLQTAYIVEAWQSNEQILNVSHSTPEWKLSGLAAGKTLKLAIYAKNARGISKSSILRVHTLPRLVLHTEPNSSTVGADMQLPLVVPFALFGVVVGMALLVWRRCTRQSAQYAAPIEAEAYSSTLNETQSPMQPDDKNPDPEPLPKGLNYTKELETFPQPALYGGTSSLPVSMSAYTHQHGTRSNAHTLNTPTLDAQGAQGVKTA